LTSDLSDGYRKKILAKSTLFFNKSIYFYSEFQDIINTNIDKINKDEISVKMIRLILNYCEEKELFTDLQLTSLRKKLKNHKSGVDYYVPTDQEILQTINQLSPNNKLVYLVYVVSGIRKVEGSYLLANCHKLVAQEKDGFVKVTMNYLRHNKNSYFCYLPSWVYSQLSNNHKLSVGSLECELKTKHLIPIKYCRKWCIT